MGFTRAAVIAVVVAAYLAGFKTYSWSARVPRFIVAQVDAESGTSGGGGAKAEMDRAFRVLCAYEKWNVWNPFTRDIHVLDGVPSGSGSGDALLTPGLRVEATVHLKQPMVGFGDITAEVRCNEAWRLPCRTVLLASMAQCCVRMPRMSGAQG
jgi:hypothetical protein